MTPYERVREEFDFPFELRPYQIKEVNDLCLYDRAGFYWEAGSGKTAGATHWMLHWRLTSGVNQWVLPMPPILLGQWARWLRSVKHKRTRQPLKVVVYRGTPKQRKELAKDWDADFILLSYGILKNDFDKLYDFMEHRNVGLVGDEGHAIKNIESDTHRAVKHFTEGRPLGILTGTPLTKPDDAYAYIRLIAPGVYRNQRQFERLHIKERDDYDRAVEWDNLELLHSNMRIQTSRIIRREVRADLPAIIYTPIHYDLAPEHYKLYKRLAEERLVEMDDGSEIDAISQQALASAMQQIIVNWGEFAEDESLKPAALDLVEETLDEIGEDKKLVVVANFVRSNRYLLKSLKNYGAVAIYGETSPSGRQQALDRFINDPACRCILLQPQSAGFGVDGLQHVCSEMLVLEAPTTPPPFHQVVARLDRDGQTSPVNCRVAIASQTVQVRMFKNLLQNDELVNSVQGGFKDLKEMIYGG